MKVVDARGALEWIAEEGGSPAAFRDCSCNAVVDHAVDDWFYPAPAERWQFPLVTADIRMVAGFTSTSHAARCEPR